MPIFVNGVEIDDTEIGREMQYHPAQNREGAWYLAAQSLVIRQLLLQQAADAGLCGDAASVTAGEAEEEVIDCLLQRDVCVPEADEATCRRYYERHQESFMDDKSGRTLTFLQARPLIRDYLHTRAMRVAVAEYIRALSHSATIKGFDMTG